ncbi:hypothetical protein KFL_002500150 [Klebsormidium nitens]|uniref:Condensin-2 complex subunit H2 n=1 Tax=Klebsormidium nitens TaxID=105231 RepID=A0A1Y1IAI4_KLENI|nr:hypothetical protein KFL_002500150 [Klebsormidium nitens]|eukprot:GAQ85717.1 hypothetical protein KFL_002500150 [Klebsormidium nitens]
MEVSQGTRDQHEGESRFIHLLQPIRDLAGNWNIDIAAELSDYLEELESITFSFDGGHSTLNFAEAALVIQGSACIYSKKVESLYGLVYQALDVIAKKKRAEEAGADLEASGNAIQDEEEEEEARFLLLDDIPEGTGIDLDEVADEENPIFTAATRGPPAALLAMEDERMGPGGPGNMGGEAAAYKINSCTVHSSGALLLDPRDGDLLDDQLMPISFRASPPSLHPEGWSPAKTAPQNGGVDEATDHMDDDDNDFGGGGDNWDGPTGDPPGQEEAALGVADPAPGQAGAVDPGMQTRGAMQHGAPVQAEQQEEEINPWKQLDPHDPGTAVVRPYKRGRPVRRPQAKRSAAVPAKAPYALAPARGVFFPEFAAAFQARLRAERVSRREGAGNRATYRGDFAAFGEVAGEQENVLGSGDDWHAAGGGDDDDFPDGGDDYEPVDAIEMGDGGDRPFYFGADSGAVGPPGEAEKTYEDLVREHIDAMLKAAAAAEVQTDLAARVATWKHKIEPVLQEQDARPEFDIHLYGARVLDAATATAGPPSEDERALTSAEVVVPFTEVVKGQPKHEISRLFAAMLQLINNGNLSVPDEGAFAVFDSAHPFRLKVLSLHKPHEDMLNYRAPSMLPGEASPGLELAHNSPAKAAGGKKKGAAGRKRAEKATASRALVEEPAASLGQVEEAPGLAATEEDRAVVSESRARTGGVQRKGRRVKPIQEVGTQGSSLENGEPEARGTANPEVTPRVKEPVRPAGTQGSGLATQVSGLATQPWEAPTQQSDLATQESGLATQPEIVASQRARVLKIVKGSSAHPSRVSSSQVSGLASPQPTRTAGVKRLQRSPRAQVLRARPSQASGLTQAGGRQGNNFLVSVDESSQSLAGGLGVTPEKGVARLERMSIMPYGLSPSAEIENAASQAASTPGKGTPDGKKRKKSIRPQRPPFRPV